MVLCPLVVELRRISSQPRTDAPELFRRMCFNALISNTDDHPRNHAVVATDTDWNPHQPDLNAIHAGQC